MGESRVWTIEVLLDEDAEHTDAEAVLDVGEAKLVGWGRSRRNPADPEVPRIGEELAVARALADLSHRLVDGAAEAIEQFEGRRVHLHS